ncbi:SMI1/KNR4 family protein [Streptomyces sp. CB02613]|uniref:SMI1/KNR4 family protein n=1 Tax=Streptomyces sp. CB02613 TaxID=2020328 RepID=UPI00131E1276|nr:SMI1/KNR4 family protein [Streptomyces sp. CB02613]
MIRPLGAVRARLTRDSVQRAAGPPPLTEAEAQLGVTFPQEYRRYLHRVVGRPGHL